MEDNPKQSSMYQFFLYSRNNSKYFLRLIIAFIFLLLLSSLLGIFFILIMQGLIFTSLHLAFFFQPAFALVSKLIGLDNSEITFVPHKPKWWESPIWIINTLIFSLPLIAGIWFLIQEGFLNQNLIYLFFIK